jgi:uroporphyrinogen-III synthase
MESLRGIRVALLEARMSDELESLVRRWGGEPYSVPAVQEAPRDVTAEIAAWLDRAARAGAMEPVRAPVVVLSTGVGAIALLQEAAKLGRTDEMRALLTSAITVCRGPKPVAALKQAGLPIAVRVREPYTTRELLDALATIDLDGRDVLVVHYGERNAALAQALERAHVRASELLVYEWRMPTDRAPLGRLVEELVERRVGAIAFTSQVQARHLFAMAKEKNLERDLQHAMSRHTIVAAVGPTCAAALAALGVRPHVVPESPKMGAMISSLAHFLAARSVA